MPFENSSCKSLYENEYVLVRNTFRRTGMGFLFGVKKKGAVEAISATAPATNTRVTIVGVTETKAAFQALKWSARFIGQITSLLSINGQSVIPSAMSIDIWNKLANIAPRKTVRIATLTIFFMIFTIIHYIFALE